MTISDTLEQSVRTHLERKETDAAYAKTFECAHKDLLLWRIKAEEAADGIQRYNGLDGPHAEKMQEISAEYRKRLQELKAQFHID